MTNVFPNIDNILEHKGFSQVVVNFNKIEDIRPRESVSLTRSLNHEWMNLRILALRTLFIGIFWISCVTWMNYLKICEMQYNFRTKISISAVSRGKCLDDLEVRLLGISTVPSAARVRRSPCPLFKHLSSLPSRARASLSCCLSQFREAFGTQNLRLQC